MQLKICTSRWTSAIKREARGKPEPRVLSKGRSDVTKNGASHAVRVDKVPLPRKERAVPTAGQPLMAEPDFGYRGSHPKSKARPHASIDAVTEASLPRLSSLPEHQGWQGRWGARGAGRQKAAPPAGARGAAKFRGR